MRVSRVIILVTLFLSVFSLCYNNFFHEALYEKYLPNYIEEVEFPVYSGIDGKQVNDTSVSDDMTTYLPLLPLIVYQIALVSFILIPFLLIMSVILSVFFYIKGRKSSKSKS